MKSNKAPQRAFGALWFVLTCVVDFVVIVALVVLSQLIWQLVALSLLPSPSIKTSITILSWAFPLPIAASYCWLRGNRRSAWLWRTVLFGLSISLAYWLLIMWAFSQMH